MDKFLCEDFGLASISDFYGKFVSVGKNVFKVAYCEGKRLMKVWKYNIKENLPWKEISSFIFPLPERVDIRYVVVHHNEIFVFFRRHFSSLLYDYIPVFDVQTETWSVPHLKGVRVPEREDDAVSLATCQVGDDFLVYSSESFTNIEDFHPSEYGSSNR